MTLLIQISDIHFRASDDELVNRALAVKAAITGRFPRATSCFLILSGDVANTGSPAEYARAKEFVDLLKDGLLKHGFGSVDVVSVPGNHDLNLRNEVDTRQLVLENPEAFIRKGIDFGGFNFTAVMSVQDEFFHFESEVSEKPIVSLEERLYYRREFEDSERKIMFHCFNTAWLSRRNEEQGKLYLPEQILTPKTPPEIALSVAVFHHPYNWLNADNQWAMKNFVEQNTDVVLTGHEHLLGVERRQNILGQELDYFQAPAFRDPSIDDNGFQVLAIDFNEASQDIATFEWRGASFSLSHSAKWALNRNKRRASDPLTPRMEFRRHLQEMGTGFRHPRCTPPQCELRLRDLFIYPDLRRRTLEQAIAKKGDAFTVIEGKSLADFVAKEKRVIIFGQDDCGKSALSRVLYEDLANLKLLPLLLNGEDLKGAANENTLLKRINEACVEQYSASNSEPFLQADLDRKLIIIDDFQKAQLSKSGQRKLLSWLEGRFSHVVLFASDVFELQDIARPDQPSPLAGFERCTIKEFGRYHRQKLVEHWVRLGQDSSVDTEELDKRVAQSDKTISTLLGKNVLPHFPVTILTLLQMLESRELTNTANGAYGYMYEVLLKQALAGVDHGRVDEKLTYISGIGYAMFKGGQQGLDEQELRRVHDEYCDRYDMEREFSRMVADLLKAEILVFANGQYKFKYPYAFYYAVAKHFYDHSIALRSQLNEIAEHMYGETNANVLIFYVYLTKDEELIRKIVANSKRLFQDVQPCDLDKDVEFLNRLYAKRPPPLELECGNVAAHRDALNRQIDEANETEGQNTEAAEAEEQKNRELILQFSIAFKTLQLLGQILRNFTGSLAGPLKLEITRECYALGMRTLNAVLSIPANDLEAMRQYLGSLIAERSGVTDKQELANQTDMAIVSLGRGAAFGSIKRISYAVGHGDLSTTYARVLEHDQSLATRAIDATIKLDHFEHIPEKELKRIAEQVKKNHFTYSIMRDVVADYLYLYNVDFPKMQKLGDQWDIKVSVPKFMLNRSKK